ncbi:MAG: hypothetical protein N2690_00740, partial [Rhodocyclaceae bacterium]|nr:hypothetical protein [Rhodocyclaceae bacterium]
VEPVALPELADAQRVIRQAVEPRGRAQTGAPKQPVPALHATPAAQAASGSAAMQITFAPHIAVYGAASPEAARQQVAQAVQLSFVEFERLMRRYEAERARRMPS